MFNIIIIITFSMVKPSSMRACFYRISGGGLRGEGLDSTLHWVGERPVWWCAHALGGMEACWVYRGRAVGEREPRAAIDVTCPGRSSVFPVVVVGKQG